MNIAAIPFLFVLATRCSLAQCREQAGLFSAQTGRNVCWFLQWAFMAPWSIENKILPLEPFGLILFLTHFCRYTIFSLEISRLLRPWLSGSFRVHCLSRFFLIIVSLSLPSLFFPLSPRNNILINWHYCFHGINTNVFVLFYLINLLLTLCQFIFIYLLI